MRSRALLALLTTALTAVLASACQLNLGLRIEKIDAAASGFDAGSAFDAGPPCAMSGDTRCDGVCVDLSATDAHCGGCGWTCAADEHCEDGACTFDRCAPQRGCREQVREEDATVGPITFGMVATRTLRVDDPRTPSGALVEVDVRHASLEDLHITVEHRGVVYTLHDRESTPAQGLGSEGRVVPPSGVQDTGLGDWIFRVEDLDPATDGTLDRVSLRLEHDVCVDTSVDAAHCGACGNVCLDGRPCEDGACACLGGEELCPSGCRDLSDDDQNCGFCGTRCELYELCVDGACERCPTVCSGSCADLETSWTHCGACEATCQPREHCDAGGCVPDCPAGEHYCDEACVSTDSEAHCGACSNRCPLGATCSAGACVGCSAAGESTCPDGCHDLQVDVASCGSCGRGCSPLSSAFCSDGDCVPATGGSYSARTWGAECEACVARVLADGDCWASPGPAYSSAACLQDEACHACLATEARWDECRALDPTGGACSQCTNAVFGCLSVTCPSCRLEVAP